MFQPVLFIYFFFIGFEDVDAITYASWGIDYLKYDNCYNESIPERQRYEVSEI